MGGRRARTKIRELNNAIGSLMLDVQANVDDVADQDGGTEFIRTFAAFEGEWSIWLEEHSSDLEIYLDSLFFSLGGELRHFITRYNAFERRFRQLVGAPSQPGVYDPEEGPATNWWIVLGVGALGVAGLFGLAWLTREGRGLIREGRSIYETERARGTFRMRRPGGQQRGMAGLPKSLLPSDER